MEVEEADWQVNRSLAECNQYMLEKDLDTDVAFIVGEEQGTVESFNAHIAILSSRSPVFQKMFFGSLPETHSPINITDVTPAAFKALLRYCYQERLDVALDVALDILYAAKKYMLTPLENACRATLIKHLSTDTIWPVYVCSVEQADDELREGCRLYFGKNFTTVASALKSHDFLNIPHDVLLDLVQINSVDCTEENQKNVNWIMISEIEMFNACNAWAEAECIREEVDPTGPNKRYALRDCLRFIRFPTMIPSNILKEVFPTGILSPEKKSDLLEYALSEPENKPQTDFLSTKHHFLVSVQPLKDAIGVKGYSKFKKGKLEYSSLTITPKEGLLLSGILYKPALNDIWEGVGMWREWREIVIIENGESALCKRVCGQSTDEARDKRYLIFSLPEVLLKANIKYNIHVQQPQTICFFPAAEPRHISDKLQNHQLGDLNYKVKMSQDVCLNIEEKIYNNRIVGLIAQFG